MRRATMALIVILMNAIVSCTPNAGAGEMTVTLSAVAGPVCPVERVPPDPACADRPVVGASLVIIGPNGTQVGAVLTDASGSASVSLAPGHYVVRAAPVEGLLGTPAETALDVTASAASPLSLTVTYDTGIR